MPSSRWTLATVLVSFIAITFLSAMPSAAAGNPPRSLVHSIFSAAPGVTDWQSADKHDRCCGSLHCTTGIAAQVDTPEIVGAGSNAFAFNRDSAPFLTINQLDRPPKA